MIPATHNLQRKAQHGNAGGVPGGMGRAAPIADGYQSQFRPHLLPRPARLKQARANSRGSDVPRAFYSHCAHGGRIGGSFTKKGTPRWTLTRAAVNFPNVSHEGRRPLGISLAASPSGPIPSGWITSLDDLAELRVRTLAGLHALHVAAMLQSFTDHAQAHLTVRAQIHSSQPSRVHGSNDLDRDTEEGRKIGKVFQYGA